VGEFVTTGWAGRLIVGPLELPNRLVLLSSGIVCWCCWLRVAGIGRIPATLPIVFVLYGMAHAGAMIFVYSGSPRAHLGPGPPLTLLATTSMLVLIVGEQLASAHKSRQEQS
jgi:hypothetical protein